MPFLDDGEGNLATTPPAQSDYQLIVVEPVQFFQLLGLPTEPLLQRDRGFDTEQEIRFAVMADLVRLNQAEQGLFALFGLPYPPEKAEGFTTVYTTVSNADALPTVIYYYIGSCLWVFHLKSRVRKGDQIIDIPEAAEVPELPAENETGGR